MTERRPYPIAVRINGRLLTQAIIDPHYERKHRDHMNDSLILRLVKGLDGREFEPVSVDEDGFEYYCLDPHYLDGKPYRLVWVLHPEENYVGVLNAFRRPR